MTQEPVSLLTRLYRDELQRQHHWYLAHHAPRNSILRQVSVFQRYLPYLPRRGTFLDWGCAHAPDACLLRNTLGGAVELHGCDFHSGGQFATFHDFAGLKFRQLSAPIGLPYEDGSFDVVIGSGVLEHTANDSEALKELHRVLRDEGILVLTFLPNRLSYTEFVARHTPWSSPHVRPYGFSEATKLVLHHGFQPVHSMYHQMVPAQRLQSVFGHLWRMNRFLERAWPLNKLSANVMVVCRRQNAM